MGSGRAIWSRWGLALALALAPQWVALAEPLPYGEMKLQEGGYLRISAIGLPPFGATDGAAAREEARQNALSLAQRRLLSAVLDLPSGVGRATVRDRLAAKPQAKDKLRDLIRRAKVSGQELADGSAEVTLELPYSGPGGLADFLAALAP